MRRLNNKMNLEVNNQPERQNTDEISAYPVKNGQAIAETNLNSDAASLEEYMPTSSLGRELMEIRKKIIASRESLLGWDEINGEVARRRGEIE
jgi:hypothetical protein